jgi:hypothetical protein
MEPGWHGIRIGDEIWFLDTAPASCGSHQFIERHIASAFDRHRYCVAEALAR